MSAIRDFLHFNWLGDKICGQDVDTLFAYQTPRVTKIHDRSLGCTKLLLMFGIFLYIFVFQIWYKGEHMELVPIEGISRLQWQQPTNEWCNPHDIECLSNFATVDTLPYCTDFQGQLSGNQSLVQRDCDYYDGIELPITLPGGSLIPTYITRYKQALACKRDTKICKRKYVYLDEEGNHQRGHGEAKPVNSDFVVDAGKFTVLIDHSIKVKGSNQAYDDFNMVGQYTKCNEARDECETKPMHCVHELCGKLAHPGATMFTSLSSRLRRATSGNKLRRAESTLAVEEEQEEDADGPSATEQAAAKAAESGVEVTSIKQGDVMSLETLLALAGIDLDTPWQAGNGEWQNRRLRGTAIVVTIDYHNLNRWTLMYPQDPPSYTISVTSRPVHKFKQAFIEKEESWGRMMRWDYGVYVIVQQTGSLATFNPVHCLTMIAAAMGLMAVSNTLTDLMAMYALPNKDSYLALKYKESVDFGPSKTEK